LHSFSGLGDDKAIDILARIKDDFGLAITTDIHEVSDVVKVQDIIDLIQIPAFLCRQTDLLVAAGKTGLPVNIKKGQFATAQTMSYAVEKVTSSRSGNRDGVLLTERGFTHGYEDLVVDPKSIASMSKHATTIIDITHANQRPNQSSGQTAGKREDALLLAKVGLVAGAKGIFLETHPNPTEALSDSATMIPLEDVERVIRESHRLSLALKSI